MPLKIEAKLTKNFLIANIFHNSEITQAPVHA